MSEFKKLIKDMFNSNEVTFEDTVKIREDIELKEKKKDDLYAVKDVIIGMGFKITDINVENDKFEVEVRKGTTTKMLKIDTSDLKSPESLLKSISSELSK